MKALVTGGTRGIGLACMKALPLVGVEVVTLSRQTGYDVTSLIDVERFFNQNGRDFEILVNNVGGGGTWDYKDWRAVFEKNAAAAVQFTMACLPYMMEKGFGRVVCITSLGNNSPWFNMAKKAEQAFMLTMAKNPEYVRRGITFNCVAPGRIAVGKESDVTPEYLESLPIGRLGTPEEVANVVAFLCSPAASLVNGAVIKVGDIPC